MIGVLKEVWRGEHSLGRTYWFWGFLIQGLVIGVGLQFLVASTGNEFLMLCYLGFTFVLSIFMMVATWRSASHYEGLALWAWLARIICILNGIMLGYLFLSLFSGQTTLRDLSEDFPRSNVRILFAEYDLNRNRYRWVQQTGPRSDPGSIILSG